MHTRTAAGWVTLCAVMEPQAPFCTSADGTRIAHRDILEAGRTLMAIGHLGSGASEPRVTRFTLHSRVAVIEGAGLARTDLVTVGEGALPRASPEELRWCREGRRPGTASLRAA